MSSPRRRSTRKKTQTTEGTQYRQAQTLARQRQSDRKTRSQMFQLFGRANMGTAPSSRSMNDLSDMLSKTMVSKSSRKRRVGPKKRKSSKRGPKRGRKKSTHKRRQSPKRGTKHGAHRRQQHLRKEKKDRTLALKRARIPLTPATFQFP